LNGKRGDHPVTDIVVYGLAIFGEPADSLIRELDADGRRDELNSIAFHALTVADDLVAQLEAIRRRRPSVRVTFNWVRPHLDGRVPDPWGGWHYITPVDVVEGSKTASDRWLMDFEINPVRDASGNRQALARFLSADAPWDLLVPGAELRLTFDSRNEDGRAIVAG
jgi:hypothetical protein